jgi:hypothetical protein
MRLDPGHLEHARKVADAILYEGYLLYPYRRSATKNQVRFQFGVLMPPGYQELDDSEPSASQTECLLECPDDAEILVVLRFLQLQRRTVQAVSPDDGNLREVGTLYLDGTEYAGWDEAAEREQHVTVPVGRLLKEDRNAEFHASAGRSAEDLMDSRGRRAGQLVREWSAADGVIRMHAERVAGPYQALKLRVRVENRSASRAILRTRTDGLRQALIAAHLLIGVPGGRFLSLTDPPEWAAAEVAGCVNTGTWPVLAGPDDCTELMLSSPVILYDHAEVAAESPADLYDATEIDEILTLRTMALTDAEKREARSSDPRAAELIDRLDHLPPEMLDRLHGAIRYLRPAGQDQGGVPVYGSPPANGQEPVPVPSGVPDGDITDRPAVPWWDPGADGSVSPETDHVIVAGVRVASGSRVIMRPGIRRADAQDLFLAGREATVQAVLHDVDGDIHLAVSPDHDPAAELQRNHGRFLYFAPDEVEPIGLPGPPDPYGRHRAEAAWPAVDERSEEETRWSHG